MHILVLNWKDVRHPDAGGAELIAFELGRRLARDNEVTWFCRAYPGCTREEMIEGIRVVRGGGLLTTYLQGIAFYLRLRPRPDLIIDMINTLCWQSPLYARRRVVAYVNQLAAEVFFYHLPRPLSWIAYALERFQYVTYRHTPFLCYSDSTRADLMRAGIPEHNIRLFPLGVDHSRYAPGAAGKSPTPLFVFVGRLVPMKRANLCVAAMPRVLEQHPDAQLAIVGYGPEEERLRSEIRSMGLEHAVSITGAALLTGRSDRKIELMQRAWAHVLPSVKEGWGLVVTEAAACGTPSIVSNVTGLRDSVHAGKTGLVVSSNPTPDELAAAMIMLIEDTLLREKLSRGALEWAATFDWEISFRRFRKHLFDATLFEAPEFADIKATEAEPYVSYVNAPLRGPTRIWGNQVEGARADRHML
jgi:glycosyltransferase involved in cell wall biosynthesis